MSARRAVLRTVNGAEHDSVDSSDPIIVGGS